MQKFIVYAIKNLVNGKYYIGRTINVKNRIRNHIWEANNGNSRHLYSAMRKHGNSNFEITVLEEDISADDIKTKEMEYVLKYDSFHNGYNMTEGGDGKIGAIVSEETREKMRISAKKNGKEVYKKRNETLSIKDPDFLKNIGKKSSETQKLNGKHKGENNANFNHTYVLIFNETGDLVDKMYYYQLVNLDKTVYPVRMFIWSLSNKKAIYCFNKPKDEKYNSFIGWHCCYENDCWFETHKTKR